MTSLASAVEKVLELQKASGKPLAIVLAGHNGSGKSTMWYKHLAPQLQIPLINADRLMVSVLPEVPPPLPDWAQSLRDNDKSWMRVAQNGVQAFVAQALLNHVPFAMETVFSYWQRREDGTFASKIDQIRQMQGAGYFVLLFFVGLSTAELSVLRVETRKAEGGHGVELDTLIARFPRTQTAIRAAREVADATILADNSREEKYAFTVCRIETPGEEIYDRRTSRLTTPTSILAWLDRVAPL